MRKLKASHGTAKEWAGRIKKEGQFRSASGSLGKAIYFWGDEEYLEELALAWARYRLEKGAYGSVSRILSIFLVEIIADLEEIFTVSRGVRLDVAKLMKKHGINTSNPDEISKAYDFIIKQTEKENGRKFKVIKGEVGLPEEKYFKEGFPYKVLDRRGICYAVREPKIITIKRSFEVEV